MKNQHGFVSYELFIVMLVIAGIGGWVANIFKLAGSTFDPITGIVVLRAIGVFVAPLGSVLGYF